VSIRSKRRRARDDDTPAKTSGAPIAKVVTLERLLTSPKAFGLTRATSIQRAVCRIVQGLPLDDLCEADDELAEVLERTCGPAGAASCVALLPTTQPLEVYCLCGIRTAKSLICAAIALRAALTVDLDMLLPGEEACVSVVSIKLSKAKIIMRHLKGALRGALRPLLARKPTESTIWIRRPQDHRVVRIEIAAGANAGGSLVGDWSAGAIFDEWTRMNGEADLSVINFDDMRKAVLGRLLPGAQLVGVGSPWAPRGPAYETVQAYWGKPSERIVVLRPPAKAMNPAYWTEQRITELRLSPKGEWVYRTDYLGEFADPESAFFATAELESVIRRSPVHAARDGKSQYFAAMDPAARRNAWTLVIGARIYNDDGTYKIVVAFARQWLPRAGVPLKPEVVMKDIKAECARYGVREVFTDQWSSDAIAALGRHEKLTVTVHAMTTAEIVHCYDALRLRVLEGPKAIELHGDPYLRGDLLAVRKVVTNQAVRIALPITSDGRHADYAPPTALLCEMASSSPAWIHAMTRAKARGEGVGSAA
jgi:hypothetical protein